MFFTPLKGVINKKFNPKSGQYGINITAKPSSPVAAALPGTIINISYTISDGYSIVMSNDNNFITVYSNLSDVMVSPSQKIYAGQPIAISQTASESSLHFELWQNNMPLNPEDF
ncbi:MAG: M23 family metallopeptidase, partial [Paludibacteraceae bacterium]|nr:M23 family metallopeptidase [Paludibacteraceae bacterium]